MGLHQGASGQPIICSKVWDQQQVFRADCKISPIVKDFFVQIGCYLLCSHTGLRSALRTFCIPELRFRILCFGADILLAAVCAVGQDDMCVLDKRCALKFGHFKRYIFAVRTNNLVVGCTCKLDEVMHIDRSNIHSFQLRQRSWFQMRDHHWASR